MNENLTLLQRAVILRLSQQGYTPFADKLRGYWMRNEQAPLVIYYRDDANPPYIFACFDSEGWPYAERINAELAEQLSSANEQTTGIASGTD